MIIALVDCNNFFVSCEKVFKRSLENKPVVVLSSNDGCVVSRSNEAKKLGIPMGAPAYKYQSLFQRHDVAVFSSNFALYSEISRRVMQVLEEFNEEVRIYSVDEAFLFLKNLESYAAMEWMRDVKEKVYQYTGIPISVGLSATKTLAKAANKLAKKDPARKGICYLAVESADAELQGLAVGDLWGIGRRLSKKLRYYGIHSALDLKYANDLWLQKKFSIQGLRVAAELRGINCSSLEDKSSTQKSMIYSRSFGHYVYKLEELSEVASDYISTLARKLRKEKLLAGTIVVWITTNRFNNLPRFSNSGSYTFQTPSSYTAELIIAAQNILKNIYKENYAYNKLGIIALDLASQNEKQTSLLERERDWEKEKNLMEALDSLNYRYGRSGIFYASSGINHQWQTRKSQRSPRYLSDWNELLTVKA